MEVLLDADMGGNHCGGSVCLWCQPATGIVGDVLHNVFVVFNLKRTVNSVCGSIQCLL